MARYRLGEEIGRGALGRVVRVHDDESGETLAGKLLHASHRGDPRAQARFEAEARLLAGLRHPNLVAVRGLVDVGGERVLLMELVDGPSLATLVATEGTLAPERVVRLGGGIAAGLGEAHRVGLIHRDLKPANILVAAGDVPRIVDFGLARAASFAGVAADAFAVVGTPDYMAPEALDPLAVDPRSDLYALGCILHELVTGRPPYAGPTAFAVLEAHRGARLPELAEAPRALGQLVRWLLAKSAADRPQSAAAVEHALADLVGVGAARALAPAGAGALAALRAGGTAVTAATTGGRCPSCGAACLPQVPVCFACGAVQARLDDGPCTVFVIGPGEVTHKLDLVLRQRLLDWLHANPGLGLDPGPLAKQVPRLPFVLATGVDPASGEALAKAVGELGLTAEVIIGGRFALPAMRRKAWTMSGRIAAIAVASAAYGLHQLVVVTAMPILGLVAAGVVGGGLVSAGRGVARRRRPVDASLPPALSAPIERLVGVVPALEAARHRDSLRGVVGRALALRASLPEPERVQVDADLGRLIDLATVAAGKLDELERELGAADLRGADAGVRRRLQERDAWAARLLEVTGFLDALRARWAARAAAAAGDLDLALAELRIHVEALEEAGRA